MCDYCSWIDQILARITVESTLEKKKPQIHVDPVIVVHGGAGKIPRKIRHRMLIEVKNAAIEAYKDLINGRSAVHAVEKAISHMESKPYFNCAKGGSMDINDEIVTDAAIVTPKNAGCVGAVRDIEHPIALARMVMKKTEHILLVENGAQKFALDNGVPILSPGSLNVEDSLISLESGEEAFQPCTYCESDSESVEGECKESKRKQCDPDCVVTRPDEEEQPYYDLSIGSDELSDEPMTLQIAAVGAVAYDRKRRLASGTSTAGEPGKPIGLITATGTIIGCGVFANEHGCVSVSGNDTCIYCYAPARRIVERLHRDSTINYSLNTELENLHAESGESHLGAIAVNAKGNPCVAFKTMHFPWAFCRYGYVYYGVSQDDKFFEKVTVLERPLDCMCNTSSEDDD
ncbi:isoaspartyl peptidase/L-asparaginase [Halictus rubicundus]|uniref:isoaspartyl peptidase/L-asparaginase n=1 Tax=Halictus rubicundus TaxID=77578 RepID=UPI004035F622